MTDDTAAAAAPSRRPMFSVVIVLAGAAVLGLVATGRTWAVVTDPASLTQTATSVTGGDLVPLAAPVFLVALAAALVIPVMGVVGRRIVGVVLAALALVLVMTCVPAIVDLDGAARRWIGADHSTVTSSVVWPLGTAVVALIVAAVAIVIVLRAPTWPGLSSRYERRSARRDSPTTDDVRGRDTWDALDRGDDPTS